jgi:hypothetical protein
MGIVAGIAFILCLMKFAETQIKLSARVFTVKSIWTMGNSLTEKKGGRRAWLKANLVKGLGGLQCLAGN